MRTSEPRTIYLKDYKIPNYLIDTVDLRFDIREKATVVTAISHFRRHPKGEANAPLVLDGESLKLLEVQLEGITLAVHEYQLSENSLTLPTVPAEFDLKVITEIEPDKNTALQGLYRSDNLIVTQNEAEGFRRITYFLDRPDVMAVYTTTIEADKKLYPVLLSNGNLIDKKDLGNDRHQVKWHDPFRKPCYLYALVAGDLGHIADTYTTRSARNVRLELYVDKGDEPRAQHALNSLKQAMKWDEDTFGLEYDLDIFMITSVNSFNAGAMENKGLNIFNSKLVLADPETATDSEYEAIQGVVGHEYFHNWTGNRVTCRDWFQLSLKEGLTVFRDQEFSADMNSRPVARIGDVNRLRTFQFAEDAGPMAHPVRPPSYISVDNFYTLTVYEKGAEVVRMIHTLVGSKNFRKGMDKYFELYDGQAVTTDDFVHAMELASGMDLTQFRRWYNQAGTPELSYQAEFDQKSKTFTLTLSQMCPPTPGQDKKEPFYMPVAIGLLNSTGQDMPLALKGESAAAAETTKVLHLKDATQTFCFENVSEKPVLSFLRNFSAPVKVKTQASEKDLLFLMAHDSDPLSRWEAGQSLARSNWQHLLEQIRNNQELKVSEDYIEAYAPILADHRLDPAFKAQLLRLPELNYLMQFVSDIDPAASYQAREFILKCMAMRHSERLQKIYEELASSNNKNLGAEAAGQRALRNTALGILSTDPNFNTDEVAYEQFKNAQNMTVRLGALYILGDQTSPQHDQAFSEYYERFHKDPGTIDKWFTAHALSHREDTLDRVAKLMKDPAFNIRVPNKCYALFLAFGMHNPLRFHDEKAYEFIADRAIETDKLNSHVGARLVSLFNQWKRFEPRRREAMKTQLQRILASDGLSKSTYEIASKALK